MSDKEIMGRAILAFNDRKDEKPINIHIANEAMEVAKKIWQQATNDNLYYEAGPEINQHFRAIKDASISIQVLIDDMKKIECDHNEKHCTDCHDDADCRCFDPEG